LQHMVSFDWFSIFVCFFLALYFLSFAKAISVFILLCCNVIVSR
jgi:hypothetical protein